jgi:tetratricopeptide (TPR) repeat protein
MLFDLRGSGRRTTVKVVYVLLAVLMGGGLVLFGIGGSVSGGLIDAITQQDSTTAAGASEFQKRATATQQKAEANPKDAAAWAEAARARYQLALSGDNFDQNTGQFTDAGKAQLRTASADWEKHLALNPNPPNDSVAGIMVNVYAQGLNDPAKAVAAQEIVTEARPKSKTFANLAVLAYQAGQTRKGDLATKKALDLADPADRQTLKSDLEQAKQQAVAAQIQNATPTPTATPGSKKKKKSSGG